jgi:hypothetical protein
MRAPRGSTRVEGAVADAHRRRPLFGPAPSAPPGEVVKQVVEDATALVKAEIALAKAEVMDGVKEKATGAGMFAVAAALGAVAGLGLLITIGFVLAEVAGLPGWASALIVSVALLLVAGILVALGRKKVAADITVETTKLNVEEDVAWIKQHLANR